MLRPVVRCAKPTKKAGDRLPGLSVVWLLAGLQGLVHFFNHPRQVIYRGAQAVQVGVRGGGALVAQHVLNVAQRHLVRAYEHGGEVVPQRMKTELPDTSFTAQPFQHAAYGGLIPSVRPMRSGIDENIRAAL